MTAYRSISAFCDHPECDAHLSDLFATCDLTSAGWWVSDADIPLYGSLESLCPDHAPEED